MQFTFAHHQVTPDLHMFRTHMGRVDMMFNAYVLMAEQPVLFHTGNRAMWAGLRAQLTAVLPLDRIAYVVVPHVEADECGALPLLLQEAQPTVVASRMGSNQLIGMGLYDRPQAAKDGDRLDLGDRELELISIPSEMHLWDGLIALDCKTGTLFSSDFLSQVGGDTGPWDPAPNLANMAQMATGNVPAPGPYQRVVERLLGLDIRCVAPGHGTLFTQDIQTLIKGYFNHTITG